MKDGSILDWYPSDFQDQDFDMSKYESYCEWVFDSAESDGSIYLGCSAYKAATELLETDDLGCPSFLWISFNTGGKNYSLSIPFNRNTHEAHLSEYKEDE